MSLAINVPNQYEIASAIIPDVGVYRKVSSAVTWDEIRKGGSGNCCLTRLQGIGARRRKKRSSTEGEAVEEERCGHGVYVVSS